MLRYWWEFFGFLIWCVVATQRKPIMGLTIFFGQHWRRDDVSARIRATFISQFCNGASSFRFLSNQLRFFAAIWLAFAPTGWPRALHLVGIFYFLNIHANNMDYPTDLSFAQ